MAFTRDWLSSWILDHSKFKTQPSYVRGLMDDVGERLAAFLYGFTTGETFIGFKMLRLITIGTGSGTIPTGTGVQAAIHLQGKTIGGKTELIVIDADGNEIQFTSKGNFLANDSWLTATDAAGTGGVNIVKINTGGQLEFALEAQLKAGVNLNGQQAKGMCLELRTTDTGCSETGRIWFRTDL